MIEILKNLGKLVILGFAGIGVVVTTVYIGMQTGSFNVPGSIDNRNAWFGAVPTTTIALATEYGCQSKYSQVDPCEWDQTVQWEVVKGGLIKDVEVIKRVSAETGVSERMIAAAVTPEQIRFFADNREVFKRYFEPLKLLASLSKFSLGVSGIKQDTAFLIEQYANSTSSEFYPGPEAASLLSYQEGDDQSQVLFERLTNEKDHYYSYLYTALFLKEVESQWRRQGYDISERPDVLVTLFNLGFNASVPKADPKVSGSTIKVGGQSYSFGYLGTLFYQSDELSEEFSK
ncbi:hypothetical protein H6784_01395 [Candidatus Nomurabacteria bacterium]|nr:hypothetical protein [Candidatus Kaiserbacteria bacterium]MCB9814049.1 hypothetical protein [Candidatus Nomurabacteria bacterium]